jgi:formyltetrahydrofolate synthetase
LNCHRNNCKREEYATVDYSFDSNGLVSFSLTRCQDKSLNNNSKNYQTIYDRSSLIKRKINEDSKKVFKNVYDSDDDDDDEDGESDTYEKSKNFILAIVTNCNHRNRL